MPAGSACRTVQPCVLLDSLTPGSVLETGISTEVIPCRLVRVNLSSLDAAACWKRLLPRGGAVAEVVAVPSCHCTLSFAIPRVPVDVPSFWVTVSASGCLVDMTKIDLLNFPRTAFSSTEKGVPLDVSDDRGGCVTLLCALVQKNKLRI